MMFVKDLLKLALLSVLLYLIGQLLGGCRPLQHLQTHTIERRDSLVLVPGSSVEKTLILDSLAHWPIDQWQHYTDSANRAMLSYMRDRLGRLRLKAECSPDTFKVQHTKEVLRTKELVQIIKTPQWVYLALGAMAALCVMLAIKK